MVQYDYKELPEGIFRKTKPEGILYFILQAPILSPQP